MLMLQKQFVILGHIVICLSDSYLRQFWRRHLKDASIRRYAFSISSQNLKVANSCQQEGAQWSNGQSALTMPRQPMFESRLLFNFFNSPKNGFSTVKKYVTKAENCGSVVNKNDRGSLIEKEKMARLEPRPKQQKCQFIILSI